MASIDVSSGRQLLLAAPQRLVLRLLSLTDLTGLLPVFASVDQAASDGGRSPALPGLARDQAGGEAPLETVKFTAREITHHRPGRGRLPQAMRMQRGGRHSQQQRQVRWPFSDPAEAANGPAGVGPG